MDSNEIIIVKQLPIIEEQLQTLKAEIEARVSTALAMECTDKTLKEVKQMRTSLRKELDEFEQRRKDVKAKIEAPYKAFEEIYKECVSNAYKNADAELKRKIDSVEAIRRAEKLKKAKEYAEELKQATGLFWLDTDRIIPPVTLSVSVKSLIDKVSQTIDNIKNDVDCIDDAEILAEYQKTLNFAQAQKAVKERREAIERAKQQAEQTQKQDEIQRQAESRIDEIITPPTVQEVEKTYRMSFTVVGTRSQLKEIKQFLESRGIQYE